MILNKNMTNDNSNILVKSSTKNTEISLLEFFINQDRLLFDTILNLKKIENHVLTENNLEMLTEAIIDYNSYINTFILSSKNIMARYNGIFFKNIKKNYFDKIDKIISDNKEYLKTFDGNISITRQSFLFSDIPKLKPLYDVIDDYNKKVRDLNSITELDVSEERTSFFAPNNINELRGKVIGIKKPITDEDWKTVIRQEFRHQNHEINTVIYNKNNIKDFINEYDYYKRIYNSIYKDYNDIINLLDTVGTFFNKGFKNYNRYIKQLSYTGRASELIPVDAGVLEESPVQSYYILLFNKVNRLYNMIVDVLYEKMLAFIECIKEYYKYLEYIINSKNPDDIENVPAYEYMMLLEDITNNRSYYNAILEQIENESKLFKYCYENALINEEQLNIVTEGVKDALNNFIEKIAEIIDKIKVRFNTTSAGLIKSNSKWLEQNKEKLQNFNYSNISAVHVIPYWNISVSEAMATIKKFERELTNPPKGDKLENLDLNDLENTEPYEQYTKFSADFKSGLRNFLTMKSKTIEADVLNGNEIKNKILNEMIPYIENYGETVVNPLTARLTSIKALIRSANRKLPNINATEESYSILEETTLINSSLRQCLNFEYVFEQEGPANNNNQEKKENVKQEKEVKVETKSNNNESKDKDNEQKSTPKSDSQKELAWLKETARLNEIAVTVTMSVLEERYRKYAAVCKQIIETEKVSANKSGTNNDNNTNKNQKEKRKGLFNKKKK